MGGNRPKNLEEVLDNNNITGEDREKILNVHSTKTPPLPSTPSSIKHLAKNIFLVIIAVIVGFFFSNPFIVAAFGFFSAILGILTTTFFTPFLELTSDSLKKADNKMIERKYEETAKEIGVGNIPKLYFTENAGGMGGAGAALSVMSEAIIVQPGSFDNEDLKACLAHELVHAGNDDEFGHMVNGAVGAIPFITGALLLSSSVILALVISVMLTFFVVMFQGYVSRIQERRADTIASQSVGKVPYAIMLLRRYPGDPFNRKTDTFWYRVADYFREHPRMRYRIDEILRN